MQVDEDILALQFSGFLQKKGVLLSPSGLVLWSKYVGS